MSQGTEGALTDMSLYISSPELEVSMDLNIAWTPSGQNEEHKRLGCQTRLLHLTGEGYGNRQQE